LTDSANPQQVHIQLNVDAVVAPAFRAIKESTEVLALCANAIEQADLTHAPQSATFFSVQINPMDESITAETRKAQYLSWVQSKGFQELARGIRGSLEQALIYLEATKFSGILTTWEALQHSINRVITRSRKANFPDLLGAVNVALAEPLTFSDEFLSLQKVRNCLEHRGGVVMQDDVELNSDTLVLRLPRLKAFFEKDGHEIEVAQSMVVEAGTTISIRRETKERSYRLGERISFTQDEFQEIALACQLFAQDIATKLPRFAQSAQQPEQSNSAS
jgi:hypothetical protein